MTGPACLAASAGSGAEPQGWILHAHPRQPSPYVNIGTSNRVITLIYGGVPGGQTALQAFVVELQADRNLGDAVPLGEFGRLRDVVAGPQGTLWILTNNTDGRGAPRDGDDRLVQLTLPED